MLSSPGLLRAPERAKASSSLRKAAFGLRPRTRVLTMVLSVVNRS